MHPITTDDVLKKLTSLAFSLNSVIDSGLASDFSIGLVKRHITDGSIVDYLSHNFEVVARWGFVFWTTEEKRHILGEWQSMENAVDEQRKFSVQNSGMNLLLAYVLEGIQMRLYEPGKTWPCPDAE
jgi:hypothetical protein